VVRTEIGRESPPGPRLTQNTVSDSNSATDRSRSWKLFLQAAGPLIQPYQRAASSPGAGLVLEFSGNKAATEVTASTFEIPDANFVNVAGNQHPMAGWALGTRSRRIANIASSDGLCLWDDYD